MFSLEKEIKQSSFQSEKQKLSVNIMHTASWYRNLHSSFFKKFDLTPNQYNVLRILRGQLPNCCTLQTVSERMIDKSSNTGRIIDRLLDKKLVKRKENASDRRQLDLRISEKGLEVLATIDLEMNAITAVFDSLSDDEAQTLNQLLNKLKNNSKTIKS